MNKVYLIYGEEDYFIDKEISKIKNEFSDYDLVSYDMLENNISEALEDALMGSLFSSNKLIICSNCYFLTGTKCDIDHKIDDLLKYLTIPSDNILVLTVNSETLDNRKKVVKELNKYKVCKFDKLKPYELNKFVKDYCKNNGYKINDDAVKLFLDKLNDNLYIITSELDKLFLYKDDSNIVLDDVKVVTSRFINTNIFDLINAIVEKNIDKALEVYDDLILVNEEEIKLIVTLANQFRLIYQVKSMFKSGYSEMDISKTLGVHPYRIKLANGVNINEKSIIRYLKELSLLDENIKTGKVDKRSAFFNFILSL